MAYLISPTDVILYSGVAVACATFVLLTVPLRRA